MKNQRLIEQKEEALFQLQRCGQLISNLEEGLMNTKSKREETLQEMLAETKDRTTRETIDLTLQENQRIYQNYSSQLHSQDSYVRRNSKHVLQPSNYHELQQASQQLRDEMNDLYQSSGD